MAVTARKANGTIPTDGLHSLYQQMGEVTAVSRETGHAVRIVSEKMDNLDGKVDALALVVAAQGHLREDVIELKKEIAELKADKLRREGAIGLLAWMGRNWPGTIIMALIGAALAYANGMLT